MSRALSGIILQNLAAGDSVPSGILWLCPHQHHRTLFSYRKWKHPGSSPSWKLTRKPSPPLTSARPEVSAKMETFKLLWIEKSSYWPLNKIYACPFFNKYVKGLTAHKGDMKINLNWKHFNNKLLWKYYLRNRASLKKASSRALVFLI